MSPISNRICVDESDIIHENEEIGFFFIQDTIVTVQQCINNSNKKRPNTLSSRNAYVKDEWVDIHITEENEEENNMVQTTEEKKEDEKNPKKANVGDSKICQRCNVVLLENNNDTNSLEENGNVIRLEYRPSKDGFFNGLLKDSLRCDWCMHVDECTSTSNSHKPASSFHTMTNKKTKARSQKKKIKRQRTDASLLMGNIFQCKDAGFVRIEKFQILFCGEICRNDSDDTTTTEINQQMKIAEGNDGCNSKVSNDCHEHWKEVKCSLAITISLPHLENVSKSIVHQILENKEKATGNDDVQYDDFLTTQSKGLASYSQLLFSLLRSDWSWLDETMKRLKLMNQNRLRSPKINHDQKHEKTDDQSNTTSVFPPSLSLEELYCRIRGASGHQTESFITVNNSMGGSTNEHESSNICILPCEIMTTNIAAFLRAKSLHHLRMTCKYMNYILRGVVPGMKLKLYPHQVRSLQWMRQREMRCVTDDDALQTGCDNSAYSDNTLCGDLMRSVSSGSIIAVTPRRNHNEGKKGSFWHINTWTGGCSIHYRNERLRTVARCRSVARGGLLCDDPGMGKTITFLSCILQTFGQSTERTNVGVQKKQVTDDLIVDSYWRENLVSFTRSKDLVSICMQLRKCDVQQYFEFPVQDCLSSDGYKKYISIIKEPTCLQDVLEKVQGDEYNDSIFEFAEDVRQIYKNAMDFNDVQSHVHQDAVNVLKQFETIFEEFRQQQLTAAIGAQKRSKQSLSTLVSESRKMQLLDTLLSSRATLLVVPHTLINHWEEQIKLHVNFAACSKKFPLIFRRKGRKLMRMETSAIHEVSSQEQLLHHCNVIKTHFPFLFIDECNEKLPSEDFLSQFYVVLTTTKRLTMEWKNGSFEEELRKNKEKSSNYRSFNYDIFNEHNRTTPCPLLKVHWLRLVVDEGHTMGKKGSPTNSIEFCSWITADYRWAITGTPTPQKKKCGADNLFGLMKFLKHDYFLTPHFGEERSKYFGKALKQGQIAAFVRLQHLLNLFMVRHTKKDIELHKPVFAMTRTDLSQNETKAYDTLVTAVQMNLITTSMKGKTSGAQDSILNSRQTKHAQAALRNIRLACSGGTSIVPTISTKFWNETIDLMRITHKVDERKISKVEKFLTRMTTEELSVCGCCGIELQTLFLLPCACQICTECMNPSTNQCVSCKKEFDIDDFQRLQPGLDYTWKWNITEAQKQREETQNMEQSIRESLITGQERRPNLWQDNNAGHNADHGENNNDQGAPRNRLQQQRRRRRNEPHVCIYPDIYGDGRCKICFETHPCNFMQRHKCDICHNVAEECPKEESKAFYIIEKLLNLWSLYQHRGIDIVTGKEKRPLKVLIFTQFQQVSNLVGDRLIRRFGTACIAEYWGTTRNAELERFRSVTDCFCMLLNRDGSHGLNLSFVTHIFFLDEILDKSLESQVVSRAYRMGATENVFVEQLVSRHTIEELIVLMNKREEKKHDLLYANSKDMEKFESEYYDSKCLVPREDENKVDPNAKVRYILSNMKLIRPNHMTYKKRRNNLIHSKRGKKRIRFADDTAK